MFDDLRAMEEIRLPQDLSDRPVHLLVGKFEELLQVRDAVGRVQFEDVIDVLGGENRFEDREVSQGQLSTDLQGIQLKEIDPCFTDEFGGQLIGNESLRRVVVLQIVTGIDRQTLGEIGDLIGQAFLFDHSVLHGHFAQRITPEKEFIAGRKTLAQRGLVSIHREGSEGRISRTRLGCHCTRVLPREIKF